MPGYTLTLLDTVGIQEYVFGSNVLRENIGASQLIWEATHRWPLQYIKAAGDTNIRQVTGTLARDLDPAVTLEGDALVAEVIYAGGGNVAVLFADKDRARAFVSALSARMVADAPGLALAAVHVDGFDWETDSLAETMQQAFEAMGKQKQQRRVSTPLAGLGTSLDCRSTGLPAVGHDPHAEGLRPISARILAKLTVKEAAEKRLAQYFKCFTEAGLKIPYDFDDLGRQAGEISYIAVVHADGNNMGDRLAQIREDFGTAQDNRAYIEAMRTFSSAVEAASAQALDGLSGLLCKHWRPDRDVVVGEMRNADSAPVEMGTPVELGQDKKNQFVPFRPIVFGGDDLTFVADGRLGLSLAAAYLGLFEEALGAQHNPYLRDASACAGVAVVKAHYPFARAYQLAEALCSSAKRETKENWGTASALDWHFAASGLFGELTDIRARQYHLPNRDEPEAPYHLEMRPVLLHDHAGEWRTWPRFTGVMKAFLLNEDWRDKRNKVIALRRALRAGAGAVEQFRGAYGLAKLPTLDAALPALQETGWDGAYRCGYFDAIEALDFFLPLEG